MSDDVTRLMESLAHGVPSEEGMLTLGLHHWKVGDVVEAYKWLLLAADFNNPYASIHEKELVREMTAEQVYESRRRVFAFRSASVVVEVESMSPERRAGVPTDAIV
ncbi:MAG: hypothetical protein KDJ88_13690 [Bauldia sp.]|nr:hypothetical protein [Bauldia sp.]